jgi:hypothetical protein
MYNQFKDRSLKITIVWKLDTARVGESKALKDIKTSTETTKRSN